MNSTTSSSSGNNSVSSKLSTSSLARGPKLQNVLTSASFGIAANINTAFSAASSVPSSAITSSTTTSTPTTATTTTSTSPTFAPRTSFSNASSPAGTPYMLATDSSRGRYLQSTLASPAPLELDESLDNMMAVNSIPSVPPQPIDQVPITAKGTTGLMRRISRGAANKLTRRRQSSTQRDKRERSSGPVIMRRRSDSKTHPLTGRESTLDWSFDDEDNDLYEPFNSGWAGSEATSISSDLPGTILPREAGVVAPKVDSVLQRGTLLTKVTKKKKKQVRFFLDLEAAKVRWDLSNPSKRFYIDDIKQIHVGADARNYREEYQVSAEAESRWITIVLHDPDRSKGSSKFMHLITPDDYTLELWTATLEHVMRYRIGLMTGLTGSSQSESSLRNSWQREISRMHSNKLQPAETEFLDLPAIESVCQSLHINCSKDMLRAQFAKADVTGKGNLNYSEFKEFIAGLKERKDLKQLYKQLALSNPEEGLSLDEFLEFLRVVQREDIIRDRDYWSSIFERVVRRTRARANSLPEPSDTNLPRMNLDALTSFLQSEANGIYSSHAPESRFDRPLNEYFISSSHNTYLLGRQVAGASSTEAYITALQQGCRCVEIDCWDGSDGRPIVSHGRTLTTSVLFADCITVINRYAFISSDFPLILSLEVHCNPEQQFAMVKIMKETFGEQLILEPLLTNCAILPSPEELKNRILVKVKTCDEPQSSFLPEEVPTKSSFHGRKRSSSTPFLRSTGYESLHGAAGIPLSSPPSIGPPLDTSMPMPVIAPGRRSGTTTSLSSATEDSDSALINANREKKRRQRSKITKPLSDLGVYTRGYKWHSFAAPESKQYNHVYSFAERAYESVCRDAESKALFEIHNRRFLTRVYPSAFRLKSSNFDPTSFWRSGVQMAALNWQTYDIGMQMNQAMFAAGTDRTGYVLKPEAFRRPASALDAFSEGKLATTEREIVRLSVDIISAQQLPRPRSMGPDDNINPYIEVEMYSADDRGQCVALGGGGQDVSARNGMSGLGLPHRRRTKIEASNGFSPVFNEKLWLAVETKYPDLVFIRWTVWSSPDGRTGGSSSAIQLASFTAKFSSLSQGYRYLPLYDDSGDQYLFSTLFCRITKEELVPVQRLDLDELKAERKGLLQQISQTVKRTRSKDRDRAMKTGADRVDSESIRSKDYSPFLRPVGSASPTIPPLNALS
ncbi:1-phosphatidylinositol-4,5-bisphosphate phosphodiesterase Plc1, putative [Talaromyces stipitatus ATCC 10500]|uniref:Phosphoinositide phospholipase C n=1 Tax=Talaromyces stipitatus (strain ATCC 10500 / CBS 375.48 / QM 6759 / NRRL 1006) TaxID=441959 RepID=B8M266_TALSN|nr:1-phosphatidylinositol-4,5-bisphosphate phosphodiesterase Plc1, putative [Talaromyces stipitatus ATCC 10500]EED21530.1 1-phosphatidylinositol-4,5-bisphosphate phosphodiesterase Plc1, putative [Talaromyces stipitatus ATCC 10500]